MRSIFHELYCGRYTKHGFDGSIWQVYLCIFVRKPLSIDNRIVSENWDHGE